MSSSLKVHSKLGFEARQDESLVPTMILGIKVEKPGSLCLPALFKKEPFNPPNSGENMPALAHVLGSYTITHVTDDTYRFDCPFSAPCLNVVARVPSQASGRCAPSLSFTTVCYAVVDLVEGDVARQET